MRLKLVACEMLCREVCAAMARSRHRLDLEFLPVGLHASGAATMRERLQEVIDEVDPALYDAIVLGYALCGNGTDGLVSRAVPLVIPRAHDCIGLLLGERRRHREYFDRNPGVYFRSTGWVERGGRIDQPGHSLDELVARYGEENGAYVFDQLSGGAKRYSQITYIRTGLEADARLEQQARAEAEGRGWKFETVHGDLRLFDELFRGDWDERDFLVVPPGWRVRASYREGILERERVE